MKNGKITKWQDSKRERWKDRKDGKMERWQEGKMARWKDRKEGKMERGNEVHSEVGPVDAQVMLFTLVRFNSDLLRLSSL